MPGPEQRHDDGPGLESRTLRYGVLDVETRRSAAEVGGWGKACDMGVSVAVLYDAAGDAFHTFTQDELPALCERLAELELVVGFNIARFDYAVLSGCVRFDFQALPTLDMLKEVHARLGYRLSLDHLAEHTLGAAKTAHGLQALEWWKQGRVDEIAAYCRADVALTRDLYLHGREHRHLVFRNKAGKLVRLPVAW